MGQDGFAKPLRGEYPFIYRVARWLFKQGIRGGCRLVFIAEAQVLNGAEKAIRTAARFCIVLEANRRQVDRVIGHRCSFPVIWQEHWSPIA